MMATEVTFLYLWLLAENYRLDDRSLDSAISSLDDIASTSNDPTTGMWAMNIVNFIRKYKA